MPTLKKIVTRDPERTKRRILQAALTEFSTRGYSGARVDTIARRAKANKRMLYHYFHDKDGLFCAVLRQKIGERMALVGPAASAKVVEASSPALWFKQNCQDIEWVRLLAWESLQTTGGKVLDERERRLRSIEFRNKIEQRQRDGKLRKDLPAAFMQLAKVSLSMFPVALPQVTRLITGKTSSDPVFQRDYEKFLETISAVFRP